MYLRTLTDDELLRHVDNLPDAPELARELARRLRDSHRYEYTVGLSKTVTAQQVEIQQLRKQLAKS